ncbi:MAG: hypothetical protein EBZ59_10175, partial [Planctomycetia bacterium]|nr:hypothetical protein [Planctomycetia bacterium]
MAVAPVTGAWVMTGGERHRRARPRRPGQPPRFLRRASFSRCFFWRRRSSAVSRLPVSPFGRARRAAMMKGMAGLGLQDRVRQMQRLQGELTNPAARLARPKGDTGKRLTADERRRQKKQREKDAR